MACTVGLVYAVQIHLVGEGYMNIEGVGSRMFQPQKYLLAQNYFVADEDLCALSVTKEDVAGQNIILPTPSVSIPTRSAYTHDSLTNVATVA